VHELTKIHESVLLGYLDKVLETFSNISIKGEYVLIVEGYKKEKNTYAYSREEVLNIALEIMKKDKLSLADTAKKASDITGVSKNDIYKEILKNKKYINLT
jgi:16S rRNA (cytidine1402-2'-O)-methyltransferase